jgi:uncharacterized protein YjbI with pentapeptide repeats
MRGRGANFSTADLTGADLTGAVFSEVRLAQARTQAPTLPAADYCKDRKLDDRANFSDADLSGADLTGADLSCAILRGVKMDRETTLKEATLTGANLCAADLSQVDFSKAKGAASAIFAHSDLRKATLPKDMSKAHFEGAFVAGAKFEPGPPQPMLKNAKLIELSQGAPKPREQRLSDCDKDGDPGNLPK